jgi:glycosyltransferase involved in cell wall biosynthesis
VDKQHKLAPGKPLRIALVAPVALPIPPPKSGSVEAVTALLVDGLVSRGHDVTLFATGTSNTRARLHAVFPRGYRENPSMWPWELCELLNIAAAVERGSDFDVIHYQAEYAPMSLAFARLSEAPLLHTVHHAPQASEVALWLGYRDAPFVAISRVQARLLADLNIVGVIPHAVDASALPFRAVPDDYLLFLGRFHEEKGVLESIDVARRTGMRLILAAAENQYYRDVIAPLVDQQRVIYAGEVGPVEKAALLGGARALLYPLKTAEPFGLVMAEAMCCGTPVAALDWGAVREVVDEGTTGRVFTSLDSLVSGLPEVMAFDRKTVRARALERFSPDRMVDAYLEVYARLAAHRAGTHAFRDTA